MTVDEQMLSELRKLSLVTTLVNSRALETELSKYANTPERRRIWVLIDGKRMPSQIAEEGKVSERAVNYFVAALRAASLIEYERGAPPKKLLEYVPAGWLEITGAPQEQESKPMMNQTSQTTLGDNGMASAGKNMEGQNIG